MTKPQKRTDIFFYYNSPKYDLYEIWDVPEKEEPKPIEEHPKEEKPKKKKKDHYFYEMWWKWWLSQRIYWKNKFYVVHVILLLSFEERLGMSTWEK